jgi:hypothetical protein
LVVVIGAVLGALMAIVVVPAAEGDDDTTVVLEAAAATGADPFTSSVVTEDAQTTVQAVGTNVHSNEPASATRSAGNAPGLYGGTGDTATCDAGQLVRFLSENRDKARAWAAVLGIEPDRIGAYVTGLTPVVLTRDTRVTNHGFADGRATSFQAVLQAGTAVLVDANGVPRVKCACGNPLSPPNGATVGAVTGTPWPGYSTATVIVVVAAPRPVTTFVLVDIDTGETYDEPVERPTTTGQGGGAIREFDFLSRGYRPEIECSPIDEYVVLVNGHWERPIPGFDGLAEAIDAAVTYFDATGDGEEDAIVELKYFGGGNTFSTDYCVFATNGESLILAGTLPTVTETNAAPEPDGDDGDRIALWSPEWQGGDAHCCPSRFLRKVYRYDGAGFVEVGQTAHVPDEVPRTTIPEDAG